MRKAFIFDFDDCLATTNAMVYVINKSTGEVEEKVSPANYNNYTLGPNQKFGFDEFRQAEFIENGKPTFLIHLAKEVYDEDHSVYILTARDDDVMDAIASFLNDFGIKAKTIYCVGGNHNPNIPKEKREILLTIMQGYDKIYYYDDAEKNIKATDGLSDSFRSYLIEINEELNERQNTG